MTTLAQIQTQLWELITAPEGVHKALKGLDENTLPVTGNNKMNPAERLDIYAQMYFFRLKDALKEDHPALYGLLGEVNFHNLITDYLLAFPPTSYTLRDLGQYIEEFVQDAVPRELVIFERRLIELFDRKDVTVFDLQAAQKIPQENWGELKFQTIPALAIENFVYPIDIVFEKMTDGMVEDVCLPRESGDPGFSNISGSPLSRGRQDEIIPSPTSLLLWRPEFKVLYRRIAEAEANLLARLKTPKLFDELCAEFAQNQAEETAIVKLSEYFQTWLREGVLMRCLQ